MTASSRSPDLGHYTRQWTHFSIVDMHCGTGGVSNLRRMLEVELFPELWQLRTDL